MTVDPAPSPLAPDLAGGLPVIPTDPLTIAGVTLEPFEPGHIDGLRAAAATPKIWRWLSLDGSDPAGFAALIDGMARERASVGPGAGTSLPWVVRAGPDRRIVGSTRTMRIDWVNRTLEIGWTWYCPTVWAGTVNPAAKLLLLGLAFETLGAHRVQLCCDRQNERSFNAIGRLGAKFEGILRNDRRRRDGTIRDTALFSILPDEWPTVRADLLRRLGLSHRS